MWRFWLMPLMHSEPLMVQEQACALFAVYVDEDSTAFAGAGLHAGGSGLPAGAWFPLLKR
ncbi:DUF924 domain-containing protein [Cyanobium sp. ATX 6F1]|uniref:DUF924 domain-containing protein n=1 Tax=unclassified Cyanobium TaxID=2627006 RepID=UPI0020CEA2A1|nr:DUF924 domain-containing protein [Cyanobium sp. ATX 6F1]MCP9915605.1 hypothetical protein [Cyanobium sp. ATX 6F1]